MWGGNINLLSIINIFLSTNFAIKRGLFILHRRVWVRFSKNVGFPELLKEDHEVLLKKGLL